ncbi:MAG: Rossmann-like domain-containing protein [Acidobacteriota bacterium]
MRRRMDQAEILCALAADIRRQPDQPITSVVTGACLTAVTSRHLGLASLVSHFEPGRLAAQAGSGPGSVHAAASLLLDAATTNTDAASLAVAAGNSLLPPPPEAAPISGQDLLLSLGRGRSVAVVGHFPFVEKLRGAFAGFWVLEKRPRAGDRPAEEAGDILPRADVVAVTATTLLNGSLAGLLALCRPDAVVILLGPTTPFAPSLFDCGIDVLAGCEATDAAAALAGIRAGDCFKKLSGVRPRTWTRPGLTV